MSPFLSESVIADFNLTDRAFGTVREHLLRDVLSLENSKHQM